MEPHKALPELAVVGNKEMKQFVDDDIVPEFLIECQQLDIKVHVAICGTGGPLRPHRADTKPCHFNIKFFRPVMDSIFKRAFLLQCRHHIISYLPFPKG